MREDTGEERYGQLAKSSLQFTEVTGQYSVNLFSQWLTVVLGQNYFPFLGLSFLFVSWGLLILEKWWYEQQAEISGEGILRQSD